MVHNNVQEDMSFMSWSYCYASPPQSTTADLSMDWQEMNFQAEHKGNKQMSQKRQSFPSFLVFPTHLQPCLNVIYPLAFLLDCIGLKTLQIAIDLSIRNC